MSRPLRESFRDALRGAAVFLRTQRNGRIHLLATVLVVVAGLMLGLSAVEWAVLALAMSAVIATEMLNTSLEFLSDAACPGHDPLVGMAKDVAAAAVLVSAAGAAAVGLLVLGPHLVEMLRT